MTGLNNTILGTNIFANENTFNDTTYFDAGAIITDIFSFDVAPQLNSGAKKTGAFTDTQGRLFATESQVVNNVPGLIASYLLSLPII
jgi:hypothetical protein